MVRIEVRAPSRAYPVLVGHGLDAAVAELIAAYPAVGVVRDGAVRPLDLDLPELVLAGGEEAKTLQRLGEVFDFLERRGLRRDGCLVALGGGTIGDLAGFAAATWQRGVDVIQVPTTLLAMVDSAIGGKTGVNSARAKNAIGAFWQPAAVVADLDRLATLPGAQLRSGLAEVVKYAVAMDAELAGILERSPRQVLDGALDLEPVVARCAGLKARVVEADERELSGRRAILNYGHTAGHALEAASGYALLHGQAVAAGMRVAARIGAELALCEPEVGARQDALLAAFELPGELPSADVDELLGAIGRDKKAKAGRVRWVLPREIGRAEPGHEVPEGVVRAALEAVL